MSTFRRFAVATLVLLAFGVALFLAARAARDGDAPGVRLVPTAPPAESARAPRVHARVETTVPVPSGSIRVVVTSTDGTPIPGARVELFVGPPKEEWNEADANPAVPPWVAPVAARAATAGAAGDALLEVPPGRWWLASSAPGFAPHPVPITARRGDAGRTTAVALEPAGQLAGTVFDPDGRPAAGVDLILVAEVGSLWRVLRPSPRTVSSADGSYRFDAVPRGDHTLYAVPREGIVVPVEHLRIPAITSYDVRIVRGAVIEGTVRDADTAEPLAGARVRGLVRVGMHDWYDFDVVRTDALGRYELCTWQPYASPKCLRVVDPRYGSVPLDEEGEFAFLGFDSIVEGQRFVMHLRVRRGTTFRGVLRGAEHPISGIRLRIDTEYVRDHEVTTDAEGRFTFDSIPSRRTEFLFVNGRRNHGRDLIEGLALESPVPGETVEREYELDVRDARVTGRVVDGEQRPIEGALVRQEERPVGSAGFARTDAAGAFAIDAVLYEGDAWFRVSADGFEDEEFWADEPSLDEGDVTMTPAAVLAGTVRDVRGEAVAAARVIWNAHKSYSVTFDERRASWSGQAETVTGPDGSWRFSGTGDVEIVSPFDGVTRVDAMTGEDAVLPEIKRSAGVVVDAAGDPLAGARVYEWAKGDDYGTLVARTAADGVFAVDHVADEQVAVRVESGGWIGVTLTGSEITRPLRVSLLPEFEIVGTVREVDGTPATRVRVAADPELRDGVWISYDSGTSDSSGRFRLLWLGAGPHELRAVTADGRVVTATAEAGATDVVLTLPAPSPR